MRATTPWITALAFAAMAFSPAGRADTGDQGFTDTQVSLGSSCAASGNLASFQTTCAGEAAYFRYVNEELGGVRMADGKTRRIKFTWYDDAYSPPKTLENAKRLVEQDRVAAVFGFLGTATSLAARDWLNQQQVPELFVASGAPTFGFDRDKYPWSVSGQVAYSLEGTIYGDFVKGQKPNATVAVIYQNDDFGRSLLGAFEEAIKGSDVKVVAKQNYEASTASVASQITTLAASNADYLMVFTIPKFAIQTLQKANQLGWKPTVVLNSITTSVEAVLKPAGLETATGAYSVVYVMDPSNPAFKDTEGMKLYERVVGKYAPSNLNPKDPQSMVGFTLAQMMVAALERTREPTRAALLDAAMHLDRVKIDGLVPGMTVTTNGAADPSPLESMQIEKFNGASYDMVGDLITRYEGKTPRIAPRP